MTGTVHQLPTRYQGTLSKRQLAASLNRSPRWVEIQQRDNGLPFTRNEAGYCRYVYGEVLAWLREQRGADDAA